MPLRDSFVRAQIDELPNWQFYVQRQRERALKQREIAERAFGAVVRDLEARGILKELLKAGRQPAMPTDFA